MAMTENMIALIRAITNNDMPKARAYARCCVAEDTSKKNAYDCKVLANALDPSLNPQLEDVPIAVRGMLEVENPRETFRVPRYHLSTREAELFGYIDRMRRVCGELAQMGIRRPNTTLLHGASGTGKTSFGRYVAALFDMPFYYVNFSRLVDSLMGKTSQNIASIFDYVRTVPCVLMLDEIDTVSTRRSGGGGGSTGELNRVTVTLMQEFDKLNNNQIVIGASNRLDIIDPALLRRFARTHEITVPADAVEASRVIKLLLDDAGIAYDRDEIIAFCEAHPGKSQAWLEGVTVEEIARAIEARQMVDAGLLSSCNALETGKAAFKLEIPAPTSEDGQTRML